MMTSAVQQKSHRCFGQGSCIHSEYSVLCACRLKAKQMPAVPQMLTTLRCGLEVCELPCMLCILPRPCACSMISQKQHACVHFRYQRQQHTWRARLEQEQRVSVSSSSMTAQYPGNLRDSRASMPATWNVTSRQPCDGSRVPSIQPSHAAASSLLAVRHCLFGLSHLSHIPAPTASAQSSGR